ncbi:esterase/lipase family protein [Citreimonas salinaria]|uniref:Alpha/beta hydrolase family protein n=1 Tax=Citreimonas salinaria TaxID=321339 RepID=A0A1H3M3Q2_9RHOB|nr:hypothetical protein [Citreimonas salinaria]SDY71223.1 hypothetical protein SAMN05444340_11594 [Citreimonas salinaria]
MISEWHISMLASALRLQAGRVHEEESERECVVLLHGLGRGPASMRLMRWALEKEGCFRVINLGYPSTQAGIADLSNLAILPAVERCRHAPRVHFVTHSLGVILLRHWISRHAPAELMRSLDISALLPFSLPEIALMARA